MAERTIRIGSAGKTFSMTSWKVGYLTAAPKLMRLIAKAHQFLVFTTPSNLQRAVAHGLDNEQHWYTNLAIGLQAKRDMLQGALTDIGFEVMPTAATYFMNADYRSLGFGGTDVAFCRHVTVEAGVTVLPDSALYSTPDVDHLGRFCFCKKYEVINGALDRLRKFFGT